MAVEATVAVKKGRLYMDIDIKLGYDSPKEVLSLFSEYMEMLIAGDSTFKKYLEIQNYDDEIKDLEKKYGLPRARLYLAYVDGKVAGCIALKELDGENCEVKRLYVRPEFRGLKLGNLLIQKIIDDAKEIDYKAMLLDTLPFLKSAIVLYKNFGFYEIPSYNNNPMDTLIYMKLDL